MKYTRVPQRLTSMGSKCSSSSFRSDGSIKIYYSCKAWHAQFPLCIMLYGMLAHLSSIYAVLVNQLDMWAHLHNFFSVFATAELAVCKTAHSDTRPQIKNIHNSSIDPINISYLLKSLPARPSSPFVPRQQRQPQQAAHCCLRASGSRVTSDSAALPSPPTAQFL